MSLSIFVRPTYILLAAPLSIAHLATTPRKNILTPFLGLALGCLLFALYNTLLFGGPFVTAYARLPIFINGEPHLSIHPVGADPRVFLSDWSKKVWSDAGLLPANSGLLLLPLTLRVALRSRYRSFHVTCLIVALIYTLYVFSYPMWSVTAYGNRFLLPAVQLYLVPLIVALENFSSRSLRPVHGKQPDAEG